MEKKITKIEEMNEAVKVEELDMETLEDVDGGVALATVAAVVSIAAGGVTIVDFVGKRVGWWD